MRHETAQRTVVWIDGEDVEARHRTNLAALLLERGKTFRRSVGGEPRQPLCAMGTCFECRVTVGGVSHVRACRVLVRDGLVVETAAGESSRKTEP